jgi:Mg2+-importing ATPase
MGSEGGRGAGLTAAEALERLARAGANEPAPVAARVTPWRVLLSFAEPLTLILLAASVVSALTGELVSATIIVAIVMVGGGINFLQSYRSQNAIDRLRQGVAPTASALRDGRWVEIPRREVVPGDLVRLAAGDLIPADGRLLEARDLHVQQAALTGESFPVEKEATAAATEPLSPDQPGAVFLGTSVVSGTATLRVTATGQGTLFGDVAKRLVVRPPETDFERGTHRFGVLIAKVVFVLVLFVFFVSISMRRDPLQSLLFAVALAVGLTPEFFPMIAAVTLSRGALHMAAQHVIVKHLAAIQNLGSIDVLCSDKTGTLTTGEMSLEGAIGPDGRPCDRALWLAHLNSLHETGIRSPLDAAILRNERSDVAGYGKIDEIPFDFERRRLSIVVEGRGERLLVSKGAPEGILQVCRSIEIDGKVQPLDSLASEACREVYAGLSKRGHRTLAVAVRSVALQPAYHVVDEADLTLVGFLSFSDPPSPDARAAIADLRQDGVEVKILTGDNELVAQELCAQVGLDGSACVLGTQLDQVSDVALAHLAEQTTLFARVSPAQKNRIILALKARSHVVGFLGDGINDAPSLHAADVGISVASAVDVAKDAADVILLVPGLRVLHAGILEGRRAFGNVMKYLLMATSSNFGNMLSMAGAAVLLPFLPMLPMQILLNNFLYDLAQVTIPTDKVDASLLRKPRHWDIGAIRDFMLLIGPISSAYDFLTFFALLRVFHATPEEFHTGWFVESLATQCLVLFVIRTAGSPFRSRPSPALTATVLGAVIVGAALPFGPAAHALGFVPLPPKFFAFLFAATATYLGLVEVAKRAVIRRMFT